jgi:hypothetical protein
MSRFGNLCVLVFFVSACNNSNCNTPATLAHSNITLPGREAVSDYGKWRLLKSIKVTDTSIRGTLPAVQY